VGCQLIFRKEKAPLRGLSGTFFVYLLPIIFDGAPPRLHEGTDVLRSHGVSGMDLIVGDRHLSMSVPTGASGIGIGGDTNPTIEKDHRGIIPSEVMVEGDKLRGSEFYDAVQSFLRGTADEPIPISRRGTEIIEVEVPGHVLSIAADCFMSTFIRKDLQRL
jgi:hypothetical protein